MAGSNPFKTSKVLVEKRSAFDMSHSNYLTLKVGKLTPVLVEKVMPNDTLSLGANFRAQLPPIASNFFGKVKVRFNAFFVPYRLLYGAWKEYLLYGQATGTGFIPEGTDKFYIPSIAYYRDNERLFGPGTLADYLGFRGFTEYLGPNAGNIMLDLMPFLAYHHIWADWYRDPATQRDPFSHTYGTTNTVDVTNLHMNGITQQSWVTPSPGQSSPHPSMFNDNVAITSLREVNYEKDYFTTAFRNQSGNAVPMGVSLPLNSVQIKNLDPNSYGTNAFIGSTAGNLVNTSGVGPYWQVTTQSGGSISFTIPQLRTANSLQRFAETNAIAGGRYKDTILANYGVTPSDALAEVPIYLGGFEEEIYKNTVLNSSPTATNPGRGFGNYLGGVGASGFTAASDKLVDNFKFTEHGFVMVLADVMPEAVYATGCRRYLLHKPLDNAVDYLCFPSLSNSGNQPIYKIELANGATPQTDIYNSVFGYTDRYAEYKTHINETHGLFTGGQDLDFMSLQRYLTNATMGSSFLGVGEGAMDNVTAVAQALTDYGVMLDIGFSEKMIRPLPVYSIPTLCEEIHKDYIDVPRSGRRF